MSPPDFGKLPSEYQRLLGLAKEKHHLDVVPLEELKGGQTDAFLYLVSVSSGDFRQVEHFVIKFDRVNEKAKPTEIERHRLALSQAPKVFAGQNMAKLAYEVEHEGSSALFYTVAGQSLQRFRTLASNELQSRLEALFGATNDYLLKEWNLESTFEQALHPQKLLEKWLGYRLKPDGQIGSFLKDKFLIDPDTEGFLIQGQIFPNPLSYGLNAGRWKETRSIDVLTGFQHGDLNIGNILAKFAEDSECLDGYFLIDFALYKAKMPLLYDQCYLEMSYLIRELDRASFQKWVSMVIHFSSRDIPNPKEVPVELAGACAVIIAARKSFERWVHETHPSLSDDLWGQFWLAAVAAGLNFCNKAALSTEARLAGLIYSAVHLKRYCAQFGVPLPVDVRLLYDASKWGEIASISNLPPASDFHQKNLPIHPTPFISPQADMKPNLPSGTVTFLFTDIEDSTKLAQQYRDALPALLARHNAILREAIESNHGQVFRIIGDAFCAAFPTPSDGLKAALMAQRALQHESWTPAPVQVSMGVHTGEAQTGLTEKESDPYVGYLTLTRVQRVTSTAHGGQILLSNTSAELVCGELPADVSLRDMGEHKLKGLFQHEHLWQVVAPDLQQDFAPLQTLDAIPNNLPSTLTRFVGRAHELQEVKDRLAQTRLLTLLGPGGTGKTRLALQAATDLLDDFEDRVYFVDLAASHDPESVLAAIGRTVGLREKSDKALLDELKGQIKQKKMLSLLDNFEQVTVAAPTMAELLRDCPELKMLVTSREALHVRGENIFPVPPLALPQVDFRHQSIEQVAQSEAVQLFVERAQAVKPDFQLTNENAHAVAEICVRLDGLPLAIELAAARINLFSPQALLERVGSRLKLLRGGARDLPLRQQTLRDTIGWSYELLDTGEQRLFALLSVFPNCTLEAVEEVASRIKHVDEMGVDILDGVASLVDKSLIRQVDQDTREPRFLMLETIREYAAERLEEGPEFSAAARRAHATYFADLTQRKWERLTGYGREAALGEMESDIENVRTAWRYWVAEGNLEQLRKLTDCLWLLYDVRGWYHAMVDSTGDLLNVLASIPSTAERAQEEIMLRISLARALMAIKGCTQEVEEAYTRALELCQGQGEIPQLFPVLRGLSSFYIYVADFEKGARMGEQILSLAERQDDASIRVEGHLVLGYNLAFFSDLSLGLDHLEKGIANYDPDQHRSDRFRLGNNPGVACFTTSALFLWMLGFPDRALERANDAVALAKRLNHPFSLAYALFHNGLLHLWRREAEFVNERAKAVLDIAEKHEFQIWSAVATCLHGAALAGMGRAEEGLAQSKRGMEMYSGMKTPPVFWPLLLFVQAGACGQAGRPAEGLIPLDEAMKIVGQGSGNPLSSELCRLKGDLLLALSPENPAEAESWFQQALEVAQKRKARMMELRAAISLNRLWRDQGKAEQGRRLLSDAYGRFTEGFATVDLKEARALLEDLS